VYNLGVNQSQSHLQIYQGGADQGGGLRNQVRCRRQPWDCLEHQPKIVNFTPCIHQTYTPNIL